MNSAAFIVSPYSVRRLSTALAIAASAALAATGAAAQHNRSHSGGSFGGGRPSVHYGSPGRTFGRSRATFGGSVLMARPHPSGSVFNGGFSGFNRFHNSNEGFASGHGRPFSTLHSRPFFPIGAFPFAYRPHGIFSIGFGFGFGSYFPYYPYDYPYYPYYPYDPYYPPPVLSAPPPAQSDNYRVGERLHSPYYYCGDLNDGLFVSTSVTVGERPRHLYTPAPVYDRNGVLDSWRDLGATDYLKDRNVDDGDRPRERADTDAGIDQTLADITASWTKGDVEPLARHISARREIAVVINGQWRYDLEGGDFIGMTRMALASGSGMLFQFDHVHRRGDGVYAATGRHLYKDKNGTERAVYFTYVIEKRTTDYVITQIASATDRD